MSALITRLCLWPTYKKSWSNKVLEIHPAVSAALSSDKAVVALESTIISHGMPYPRNVETALAVEEVVRKFGAVPATIAVLDGKLKVGLTNDEIERLGDSNTEVIKCSRRDMPIAAARKLTGATTVAATMIIASMAGIRVFATGGIGGVHRGVEDSMDISADLEELGRTDVIVVCAGVKSILDIPRTLEYLETKGVPVIGYQTSALPAFYSRDSGCSVDYRFDTASEIARAFEAKLAMKLTGGMLVGVPIPEEHALASNEIDAVIVEAIAEMEMQGISGKDATPFLLTKIVEKTGGRSLDANIELILNNARVAAEIAAAISG
ncbi:MAG: pseudouridine-5'-phosphate glycosidase [Woeseiaceae bacterium]